MTVIRELAIRLLLGASARSWWADPGEAVRDRVLRAVEDIRIGRDDPRLLATIAFAAPVTHGALVSEHLPAALEAGLGDARTEQLLGRAAHAIADFDVSLRVLGSADEGLRDGGQFGLLTHVVVTRAWTSMLVGDWDTAATAASEGLRLARETSQPLWSAWALATLAALAGARGDDSRAAQLATEAEEILVPAQVSSGLALVQTARGLTDLSAGRYNDAFANLGRCLNPSDPAYHHREQFGAVGFYADAAALTGRQDEAREVIARLRELAVSSSAGLAAGLAYALPILATDDDAEQAFAQLAADGGALRSRAPAALLRHVAAPPATGHRGARPAARRAGGVRRDRRADLERPREPGAARRGRDPRQAGREGVERPVLAGAADRSAGRGRPQQS